MATLPCYYHAMMRDTYLRRHSTKMATFTCYYHAMATFTCYYHAMATFTFLPAITAYCDINIKLHIGVV